MRSRSTAGPRPLPLGSAPDIHSSSPLDTARDMGKGDKKTRRGKINRASYGKNRKRKPKKKAAAPAMS